MIYLKSVIKINMETQNISSEKLKKFKNTDNAIAFIYNMYHLLFCRQLKKNTTCIYCLQPPKFFLFWGYANMAANCEFSAYIILVI